MKYYPFDENETGKFVVDSSHVGAFEMELFKEPYFKYSFSFKKIFENIIKEEGFDVEKFWEQIDDAITSIISFNEEKIVNEVSWRENFKARAR